MGQRDQLIAYLATLATLLVIVITAMALTTFSDHVADKVEALGIGVVVGGLLSALRSPSRGSVTVDNSADKPVPVEPAA